MPKAVMPRPAERAEIVELVAYALRLIPVRKRDLDTLERQAAADRIVTQLERSGVRFWKADPAALHGDTQP